MIQKDQCRLDALLKEKFDSCSRCFCSFYVQKFFELIKAGADVNIKNSYGEPLLIKAMRWDQESLAHYILEKKPDLNATDRNGQTALRAALEMKDWRMVDSLIDSGANVSIQDKEGISPLHCAASHCLNLKVLEKMLSSPTVKMDLKDNKGWTPLMIAIKHGNEDGAKLFISKGANLSIKNPDGESVLTMAVKRGYSDIIQSLIESESDLTIEEGKKIMEVIMSTLDIDNREVLETKIREKIIPQISQIEYDHLIDSTKNRKIYNDLLALGCLAQVLEHPSIDDYEKLKTVYKELSSYIAQNQKKIQNVFAQKVAGFSR